MKQIVLASFALQVIATSGFGQQEFDPAARARTIAPYIDSSALAVAYVDVARLDLDAFIKLIAEVTGADVAEFSKQRDEIRQWIQSFSAAGARELYAVLGTAFTPDSTYGLLQGSYLIVPIKQDTNLTALQRLFCGERNQRIETCAKLGNVLFAGWQQQLDRLKQAKPPRRAGLTDAFQAAGNTPVQLIVLPTDDQRRVIAEMMPSLP